MAREFIPGRKEPEVPSNTFVYFFREAWRRLWTSKKTSFVAIVMIAMSLLILGAFLLVAENLGQAVDRWRGGTRMSVYLIGDASPEQIANIDRWLAADSTTRDRRFVTREAALARFKTYFPNLAGVAGSLEGNPFPPSFDVDVSPRIAHTREFALRVRALRAIPGVDDVQFDWEWLDRLRRVVHLINIIGLIAGGTLGIAAAFTIANVIRLTMMLYREEIEIMRLVGATERIIRGPFLIEGFLQGTIGALLAVGLLFGTFVLLQRTLPPAASLVAGFLFSSFLPWPKIAGLIAGGMFAGWLGSWLSVRGS